MATKKQTGATKVRVLVAGAFGQPDDVIELEIDGIGILRTRLKKLVA